MKRTMMVLAAALMVGSLAHAADGENKAEATTDTSKNPITGTVTTTKKSSKHVKGMHGKGDVKVTEKTSVHKDGQVDKKVNVEGTSTEQAH